MAIAGNEILILYVKTKSIIFSDSIKPGKIDLEKK